MRRRLVIFDLDETLVHAAKTRFAHPPDFEYDDHFVYRRPHLYEVLEAVATEFDLAVWSSASRPYVDAVVHHIFDSRFTLQFAWSVERCVQRVDPKSNGYVYIKDLRKVQAHGYALEQITMVDDSPEKLTRQPRNHLRIAPYTGQLGDVELESLKAKLFVLRRDYIKGKHEV